MYSGRIALLTECLRTLRWCYAHLSIWRMHPLIMMIIHDNDNNDNTTNNDDTTTNNDNANDKCFSDELLCRVVRPKVSLSLYVYIYIYMYTCIHIHIYTCIHMYVCIYIYIYRDYSTTQHVNWYPCRMMACILTTHSSAIYNSVQFRIRGNPIRPNAIQSTVRCNSIQYTTIDNSLQYNDNLQCSATFHTVCSW